VRKKYLFAGSDRGGERADAIYSLMRKAKLNRVDPETYPREALSLIADHPISRIEELLPWNLAADQSAVNSRSIVIPIGQHGLRATLTMVPRHTKRKCQRLQSRTPLRGIAVLDRRRPYQVSEIT
jgi:hypothetical protein